MAFHRPCLDTLLLWHIKLPNYTHFCSGLSVRFEVLTVVLLKIPLFCDVMLCYVGSSLHFEGS